MRRMKSSTPKPKIKSKAILNEHSTVKTKRLPKGLVGSKCAANLKVNGIECHSLFDTGSQSFYDQHLTDRAVQSVSDLLEIEGANGQAVQYLGYIQLSVQFPKEFVASQAEIQKLALIVPDIIG